VAFDGDGDRAVLVTHRGRVLNGDDVLLLWARSLREQGQLPKDTVVATVMSNAALEVALQKEGMRLVRCPVGDREVWETMRREGAALGGEQSGHVICAHYGVTGDGLLTAAHLLAQSAQSGKSLEERADLQPFPQVLLGVRVSEKKPLESLSELAKTIAQAESRLLGQGRVLVRYSGTENLLRVMVEAASQQLAQDLAGHIAQVAERLLA
jgi:phosphoglucosamine mutase